MSIGNPLDRNSHLRLLAALTKEAAHRQDVSANQTILLRTLVGLLLGALIIIIGLALT